MKFFVVRTDVTAADGLQRVFGMYDTRPEADAFIVTLQAHMVGVFAVWIGSPT